MKTHCCCLFQLESSTLNWFEAQKLCRERGGLTIKRNKSDQSYWTGKYRRITPWIKIKGLYHVFHYFTFGAIFQPDHFKLIVAAVLWLKYCRYGVEIYKINQSVQHCTVRGTIHQIFLLIAVHIWLAMVETHFLKKLNSNLVRPLVVFVTRTRMILDINLKASLLIPFKVFIYLFCL